MFRPPVNRAMKVLDRSFFVTTVATSAARVFHPRDISTVRNALVKTKESFKWNHFQPVKPDPDNDRATTGGKCIVLNPRVKFDDAETWSSSLKELHNQGKVGVIPYTVTLDYEYWTYDDIIRSILPEDELNEDVPAGFSTIGHIAHLNLRERFLPYKHLIAEIIKDKNNSIETVINKVDPLGDEKNEFRTFKYEVLAGEDNLEVKTRHQGCDFHFDFSKTYWNPRLHHEHERLLDQFGEGDAVCDVMAGVGPFAVPAAKKHVFVFANDLNPDSVNYMKTAIKLNSVSKFLTPYNIDGNDFIRQSAYDLVASPVSITLPGTYSKSKNLRTPGKTFTRPLTFSHYLMNLPGSAIEFLPSFVGLYTRKLPEQASRNPVIGSTDPRELFAPHTTRKLPMIHVYCFTAEADDDAARAEICSRISEKIGSVITPETEDVQLHDIRKVSTAKRNFCASFRLPAEVAFRGLKLDP